MRRFEFTADGSAKFWAIHIDGTVVTVRFGKIGTDGQAKSKDWGSVAAAAKETEKLVREKTGKGYVEVGGVAAPAAVAAPVAGVENPEVALFRATKRGFFTDPIYGEVRFLLDGDVPAMRQHFPDWAVWGSVDWVAEEADHGVIGFLRAEGEGLGPVVLLDNEGVLRITGACLVDHFGSDTLAAGEGDEALEPLRKFCEKHGLAKWRSLDAVQAMAKAMGLHDLDTERVPVVDGSAWAKQVNATRPGAASKPAKPKARKGGPKRPMSKKDALNFRTGTTRDGHAWFLEPSDKGSKLWVCTGDRMDVHQTIPGYTTGYGFDAERQVALQGETALVHQDGNWVELVLPEALDFTRPLSSHGTGPLYALGQSGTLYALDGSAFVVVPGVAPMIGAIMVRDADGGLFLVGGRTADYQSLRDVVRVSGSTVKALEPIPEGDWATHACFAGGRLAVLGGFVHVLDLGAGRWTSSPRLQPTGSAWFGPLAGAKVGFLRADDRRIHAFDVDSLEATVAGSLLFKPNSSHCPVFDGAGRVVVAGGMLGGSNTRTSCEPQVWDRKGKAKGLAGCELEIEALVAEEAVKSSWHLSGSIFYMEPS